MIIRRPGDSPPPNRSGRGAVPFYNAAEAAIEKRKSQYIHLECDHYTTWEADMSYATWREERHKGHYFCESCGKWKKMFPKPKRQPLTQQPLF